LLNISVRGPEISERFDLDYVHRLTLAGSHFGNKSILPTPDEFVEEVKFLLAAKLYEIGRLSSGQAAGLCAKGRADFLLSLPRVGVSISNPCPEDAESELELPGNDRAP